MPERPDQADGGPVPGPDGRPRCPWAVSSAGGALYAAYHDDEWGRPRRGEQALYERLTLEAFQSGLSWLTILRKRAGFRRAFAGFDPEAVAAYGEDDVRRLLADSAIVRNEAKIRAAVTNARRVLELDGGLDALLWSFAPPDRATRAAPLRVQDVPATTPESTAMARELKRLGFAFVGPTTAYALMQATGMVNDHLAGCWARD